MSQDNQNTNEPSVTSQEQQLADAWEKAWLSRHSDPKRLEANLEEFDEAIFLDLAMGSSCSSSCDCPECRIVYYPSGIEVTEENCQIFLGAGVSLSFTCEGVSQIEDIQWSLPDGAFKECTPEGELIPVPPEELTSTVVHFRVGKVGSQVVSVSYTADGVSCSTSATLCVELPKCEVRWATGEKVTDDNRDKILPGHNVRLMLWCENPDAKITDILWSPSGKAFKQYISSLKLGVLLKLGQKLSDDKVAIDDPATKVADLKQRILSRLHWADSGGKDVPVAFKIEGIDRVVYETFSVQKPKVTHPAGFDPPPIGTVKERDQDSVLLLDAFPQPPAEGHEGILFKAKVKVNENAVPDFTEGDWHFTQVLASVTKVRETLDLQNVNYLGFERDTKGIVLDNTFYYSFNAKVGPPPWKTGSIVPSRVTDSPGHLFGPGTAAVWRFTTYSMYVMFKPLKAAYGNAGPSQTVPLKRVDWESGFHAVRKTVQDGAGGHLYTGKVKLINQESQITPENGKWVDDCVHPLWSENAEFIERKPSNDVPPLPNPPIN